MKNSQIVTPWKLLASITVLDEKWFPVRKDTVQLPSGKVIDDYFVWEAPHIVSVAAITPEGKFVLVRQYRHAMQKVMMQFPAGAADKGETAEAAAVRELQEEAGYTCRKMVPLGVLAPYATKMTGLETVFLGLDATPNGEPHYDEQEESEVVLKTVNELYEFFASGELMMMQVPAITLLAQRYLQVNGLEVVG